MREHTKGTRTLTKNVSWQCPHVTRHIPGIVGTGGVTGDGARLMMRLQLGLGQATLCEELLQMSRQLQGHRTYFLPGGAFRIGFGWGTGETTFLWNHHERGIRFPYRCFIALITLHHMLFPLPRDVNHS